MPRTAAAVLMLVAALGGARSAPAQPIRGFPLEEGQEVPPTGSPATGDCVARFNGLANELTITCAHTVVGANGAHIHMAPPGVGGPIVFPFPSPVSPISGVWTMDAGDVAAMEAGNLYVNVHSPAFPNGEIRGQFTPPAADAYSFFADGDQVVPPTGSAAMGFCDGVLHDAETEFLIACHHDVAAPEEAHIHHAPPGMEGPVVFPFGGAATPIFGAWKPTPTNVGQLHDGDLYVNVHSAAFPDGEIRGQILPATNVVFADGFETGDTSRWTVTTG
jgi:hypothetical protein